MIWPSFCVAAALLIAVSTAVTNRKLRLKNKILAAKYDNALRDLDAERTAHRDFRSSLYTTAGNNITGYGTNVSSTMAEADLTTETRETTLLTGVCIMLEHHGAIEEGSDLENWWRWRSYDLSREEE